MKTFFKYILSIIYEIIVNNLELKKVFVLLNKQKKIESIIIIRLFFVLYFGHLIFMKISELNLIELAVSNILISINKE